MDHHYIFSKVDPTPIQGLPSSKQFWYLFCEWMLSYARSRLACGFKEGAGKIVRHLYGCRNHVGASCMPFLYEEIDQSSSFRRIISLWIRIWNRHTFYTMTCWRIALSWKHTPAPDDSLSRRTLILLPGWWDRHGCNRLRLTVLCVGIIAQ